MINYQDYFKKNLELLKSEGNYRIFADLEKAMQEEMLLSTLREMATIEEDFPKMVEAWRSGDEEALGAIILDSMKTFPELRKDVLDRRNQRWVKQISAFIKEDKTFMVVVGAGHMVGKRGLLRLFAGFDQAQRKDRFHRNIDFPPHANRFERVTAECF